MKRRLFGIINNPLVLIPPLVIVLALGWQQYTYAGRDLSLPDNTNIFPDGTFTNFSDAGIPAGWQIAKSGNLTYHAESARAYVGGQAAKVTVSDYHDGTLTLTSPNVELRPNTTYLFKGYYRATTAFSLLTRQSLDGHPEPLQFVGTYPATDSGWTTTSTAFTTTSGNTHMQFVYRISGNGQLLMNGLYLEPRDDVYVQQTKKGVNAIPNAQLATDTFNQPNGWLTYQTGTNTANFSYGTDPDGRYLETQVSDYKNGEAKWQYQPQPVHEHQYYQLSVDYRSTVSVPLVAEYVLGSGERQDYTIAELPPAEDWTTATYTFEALPQATTMFTALPLQSNGTVDSRNYQLIDITKPGAAAWKQPLVSITFDDGWKLSYDNAVPLLKQFGYKATYYINPSSIETPNFMTASNLTALKNGNDEIAAHGYVHDDMAAINAQALDYQLHQGRDYLRLAGFTVDDLATPYGRGDPQVEWYARKYFKTLRTTSTGVNTRQNFDPYNLKVLYINDFTDNKNVNNMLRQTKASNGWLILVYHRIGNNLPTRQSLPVESSIATVNQFRSHLELIRKSNIQVLPVAAAYAKLEQQ